jgi:hypothetical protein
MGIVTKNIHGYNIYCLDIAVESTENLVKSMLKSASTEPQVSSWGRLQRIQNEESTIKSATIQHDVSSWARLQKYR